MNHPIIQVTESASKEIQAISAILRINVYGENAIYGNAALDKAKEIADLSRLLKSKMKEGETLQYESMQVMGETGIISKTTKVLYKLKLSCSLESLPSALAITAEGKSIHLERIEWQYDEFSTICDLVEKSAAKAKEKAIRMAGSLGYKLGHLRSMSDSVESADGTITFNDERQNYGLSDASARRSRRVVMSENDFGAEIRGTKKVAVSVTAVFDVNVAAQ